MQFNNGEIALMVALMVASAAAHRCRSCESPDGWWDSLFDLCHGPKPDCPEKTVPPGGIGKRLAETASYTTVTSTVHSTQYITVPASTTASYVHTTPAANMTTCTSSNAVGPIGATGTGTGSLTPSTNGTVATQTMPATPSTSFIPYTGTAQVLTGSIILGMMIAIASLFLI